MWGLGPWGAPLWGAWWIVPLLGLLFVVARLVSCARVMRGMMASGGMYGHGGRHGSEAHDLRREVHEPREEVQHLHAGG